MRIRGFGPGARLLAALAVGGAMFGIATAVQASIPDGNGVIHACFAKNNGALRAIDTDAGQVCDTKREGALSWSQTGGPGARGATGPTGATGIAGTNGTNGTNGQNGATGATGPSGPRGPSGSLSSFDDLAGLPCSGQQGGKISISYGSDGTVTLKCGLPVGHTTLAADAADGDTTMMVTNSTFIAVGDFLRIDRNGANDETVMVTKVILTQVTFTPSLSFSHAAGAPVWDTIFQ